jgi:hypothetical protein
MGWIVSVLIDAIVESDRSVTGEILTMRTLSALVLIVASALAHPVAAQTISDESLATVLADFSEYCVDERNRRNLPDPDTADVILKPGSITIYPTDQGPVTVLDAGGMRCDSGGYGYCGVAKCTAWIFHREKSQPFLGTVVAEGEGDRLKFALCEGPKPNTGHCRDIDLGPFRSD